MFQTAPQENELFVAFPRMFQSSEVWAAPEAWAHLCPPTCFHPGAVVKADDNVEKTEDEEKGKCLPEKSFGKEINLI